MLSPDWVSRYVSFSAPSSPTTAEISADLYTCQLSKSAEELNKPNVCNPDLANRNELTGKRARSIADLRRSSLVLEDIITEQDEEEAQTTSKTQTPSSLPNTNPPPVPRNVPTISIEDRSMSVNHEESLPSVSKKLDEEARESKQLALTRASDIKVEVEKGMLEFSKEDLPRKPFNEDEEKILEILRDIVRKCTITDPMKRPTAGEVLDNLEKCPFK